MKTFQTVTEVHPELIQIFEIGWEKQATQKEPWVIPLEDQKRAMNLRQRLYAARKRLILDHYPDSANFNRLEFACPGDGTLQVYIPSWITSVQEAIKKEGKEVREPVSNPVFGESAVENPHQGETLAKLFRTLEEAKGQTDGQE